MRYDGRMNGLQDMAGLAHRIKQWGRELGFREVGISDTDLAAEEAHLLGWLDRGWHGEMDYMARHGAGRAKPAQLVPGTVRIVTARLDYRAAGTRDSWDVLDDADSAFISRYALGRDYHKVLRAKLQSLADRITAEVGEFRYRAFTDSAPVMEVALARKAGLGWRGKHTLLLTRDAGSMFFLGELFTDLPLPCRCAGERALRHVREMPRDLPDAGHRRALPARRAPLRVLPHHRAPRRDPRGAAPADGQSHLRLRRLPARVPLEQVRAGRRRPGLRGAQRPR